MQQKKINKNKIVTMGCYQLEYLKQLFREKNGQHKMNLLLWGGSSYFQSAFVSMGNMCVQMDTSLRLISLHF